MHSVYAAIINNISSPLVINSEADINYSPFACFIREAFHFLAYSGHSITNAATFEALQTAKDKLHSQAEMDIDFKRMILHYWESMVNDDEANYWEQESIIEWFSGAKANNCF